MRRWLRRRGLVDERKAEDRSNEAPALSLMEACMQASLFAGEFARVEEKERPPEPEAGEARFWAQKKSPWSAVDPEAAPEQAGARRSSAAASWRWTGRSEGAGVTLGKELRSSDTSVSVAEAALDDAREDRGKKLIACDRGFGTFIAKVEQYAGSTKDLTGLALAAMERQSYKVETPLALVGHYDPVKLHIELEAKMPPGSAGCLMEVTATPSDPESWKRVKGLARQRVLPGYPPGTYAFRASSVRGNDESDPTTAIMVVVS